jgi:hypothetical protein
MNGIEAFAGVEEAGLPSAATPVPRADRAVLAWAAWYTRGLPDADRDCRIDELRSDLFEERQAADGAPGVGPSIVGRAIRGVPGDLAWRHSRLRRSAIGAPRGTFPLAMPTLAHLATALLLAWGVLVVVRITSSMVAGAWAGAWDLVAAGVVGLAMSIVGALLTIGVRYRWLGALWLAAGAFVLIRYGTYALAATSITLTEFFDSSLRAAILVNRALTFGGVLFFIAMAVWWLPSAAALWRSKAQRVDAAAGAALTNGEPA